MPDRRVSQEQRDVRVVATGGLLILLVGVFFIGRYFWEQRGTTDETTPPESVAEKEEAEAPTITTAIVRQKILNNDKVVFIDVRSKEAYDTEHIPHSLHLSISTLYSFSANQNELVVIITSEKDTGALRTLATVLKQQSYQAYVLKGGFENWKQEGNQTFSFGDPTSFLDQSKVTYITPAEAKTLLETPGVFILDVQNAQNYQKKHLKGSVNIPLGELEKRFKEIPPGRNILVYGENELTSFQGGVRLAGLNIFTAKTLKGTDYLKPESGLLLEP